MHFKGGSESQQVEERESTPQPRLQLYMKGPGLPGVSTLYICNAKKKSSYHVTHHMPLEYVDYLTLHFLEGYIRGATILF